MRRSKCTSRCRVSLSSARGRVEPPLGCLVPSSCTFPTPPQHYGACLLSILHAVLYLYLSSVCFWFQPRIEPACSLPRPYHKLPPSPGPLRLQLHAKFSRDHASHIVPRLFARPFPLSPERTSDPMPTLQSQLPWPTRETRETFIIPTSRMTYNGNS